MKSGNFSQRKRNSRPNRSNQSAPGARPGRTFSRGRNFRRRPQGQRPVLSKEDQLVSRYLTLLNEHNLAREKHYDNFEHPDYNRRIKCERAFDNSIKELRRFEEKLLPEEKLLLKRHTDANKLDSTYSENHGITDAQVEIARDQIEDPHFLISQAKARDLFRTDKEESKGTVEDYLKYKG